MGLNFSQQHLKKCFDLKGTFLLDIAAVTAAAAAVKAKGGNQRQKIIADCSRVSIFYVNFCFVVVALVVVGVVVVAAVAVVVVFSVNVVKAEVI